MSEEEGQDEGLGPLPIICTMHECGQEPLIGKPYPVLPGVLPFEPIYGYAFLSVAIEQIPVVHVDCGEPMYRGRIVSTMVN